MRYFEHSASNIEAMLRIIDKKSLAELFSSIPESNRPQKKLAIPEALDELNLKRLLAPLRAPSKFKSFLGAGATPHFVPEWVSLQLSRAEWSTSYTPYQPELSQGTLQAIFEFQSMIASLMGQEIANASLYDGATALVEALLLAVRVKHKKAVILSETIHPEYRATAQTYLSMANIKILTVPFAEDGKTNHSQLEKLLKENKEDISAIACQSPNFFGVLEDNKGIADLAHKNDALYIGAVTDMSACGLFKSFGSLGADIAIGDGLSFLPSLSMGGPGLGLMAARKFLLRQIPGRLVGYTEDTRNNPGYVITLSTREQHIRREKATSNICTNHNLMALAFAMSMAAYGAQGLKKLALTNLKKTIFFRESLAKNGVKIAFRAPHYNETVINFGTKQALENFFEEALQKDIIAGLRLGDFYPALNSHLLVCTTELHEDESIKLLAKIIGSTYENR